jgi:hypothetical protein
MYAQLRYLVLRYYTLCALVVAFGLVVYLWFDGRGFELEVVVPGFGVLLSSIYFVQKQRLEELKLFTDLFSAFNTRYDVLNDRLNALFATPARDLTRDEIDLLYDYFNLCGEEYLYYRAGYIYPPVWRAWKKGMEFFRRDPRIKGAWDSELKSDSYYGLVFD